MINHNGELTTNTSAVLSAENRAFKYGDAVFETLKADNQRIIFFEDHYFRLMASLRVFRIDIPMNFTLEYLEAQILILLEQLQLQNSARVRITCFRSEGGLYLPAQNDMQFIIEATPLQLTTKENFEIDLYKDFYNYSGYLSTIKSTNRAINVLASIFAEENDLDTCVLLNEHKHICEVTSGNIFLVQGNNVITPSISEGCIKGVVRKKLVELLSVNVNFELEERAISPFELKKADEVFITNSIVGIQSVTKYRKKIFSNAQTLKIKGLLKLEELKA